MIRSFNNISPKIHDTVYVDEQATVIGNVEIGKDSAMWPHSVARGDINTIHIGQRTNVQDGSILHVTHAGEFCPSGFPLTIGNDVTITLAGQSGNFQLNVMLPVVAYNLLKSINLLGNAMPLLANKAIKTFKVNSKNINESLSKNPILVTALNREIGYFKASAIAKKAYEENKSIIDVAHKETGISKADLKKLLDPAKLTKGGISE